MAFAIYEIKGGQNDKDTLHDICYYPGRDMRGRADDHLRRYHVGVAMDERIALTVYRCRFIRRGIV